MIIIALPAAAQKADKYVYRGNELYKKHEFEKSLEQYRQALTQDHKNPVAGFNQGNAQFRQQQLDQSVQSFDNVINNSTDKNVQQQAWYNKGVALKKGNKLEESIEAWKQALKMNPNDQLARENLQKALRELRQKQEQQKQQQQQKKDQNKQQQKKDQQQPPPQSKLSKQRVEQLLKALQQKEKEVQERLQKEKVASPKKPEKDW